MPVPWYNETGKDVNDYEIHFETAACAPYAGFVDRGMGAQADTQGFLRGLRHRLRPVSAFRLLLLCGRQRAERLHLSGHCVSAIPLRTALFGGEAHSAVYRHENAAQRKNLRFMEEF